jgi:hypothetical protein
MTGRAFHSCSVAGRSLVPPYVGAALGQQLTPSDRLGRGRFAPLGFGVCEPPEPMDQIALRVAAALPAGL